MKIHSTAIILNALLLIYHQMTTWVPLFPWNDVQKYSRKELILETSINGILMGTSLACLFIGNSGFFHWYPVIYFPILLLGECFDWWLPYFSESFGQARKIWDYDAHFSHTAKWIPHRPGKRTPDANHIVLHLLTLITAITIYLDRLQSAHH